MYSPFLKSIMQKSKKKTNQKSRPKGASKVQAQLKQRLLKELQAETRKRSKRQQVMLSNRPKRQSKYQNLSGVKGNRQNSGFGNKKRIIVKETEYIGEVTVANQPNFQNLYTLPCNPGQSSTFPWLYTIAKNYEKYRFLELCFFYKPEVTEFTANVNTGKVILSADYDASDAAPATKQQMEDVDPHADGMPYQSIMLTLDPKQMFQMSDAKYVRIGGLPGSSDIKTYDCANFFLAVQGQVANSTIGELHVRYTVELSVPVIEDVVQAPVNNSVTYLFDSAAALTTATPYTALLASTASTTTPYTNGLNVVNTSGSIVPAAGNYVLVADVQFVGSANATSLTQLIIQKNGNTQSYGAYSEQTAVQYNKLSQTIFLTCNGTDAIKVIIEATFSSGTMAAYTGLTLFAM
jgi:phosphotransferase system IIA component